MPHNYRQFRAALFEDSAELITSNATRTMRALVFEALRRIVARTPVDTGRARGNWQVTVDAPANDQIAAEGVSQESVVQAGIQALFGIPLAVYNGGARQFRNVWISNNVEYILYLEEGTTRFAPFAMVSSTLSELDGRFAVIERPEEIE